MSGLSSVQILTATKVCVIGYLVGDLNIAQPMHLQEPETLKAHFAMNQTVVLLQHLEKQVTLCFTARSMVFRDD